MDNTTLDDIVDTNPFQFGYHGLRWKAAMTLHRKISQHIRNVKGQSRKPELSFTIQR